MLKGKTAVISGASRGIGAAIAEKLASMGADVALIYAGNEEAATAVSSRCQSWGVNAKAYRCDVRDFALVKETVKQIRADFGRIAILVNNAGVTRDKLIAMMNEEDYNEVLDTNLKGAFHLIRHCTGALLRSKGSSIINISSVSGLMGNAGQANYAASKAGLIGLTKSVAKELAPKGVRCNAIAPGFIATDMTTALPIGAEQLQAQIPLGQMGKAEQVAEAVAFLVSAEYITGIVLPVDGGLSM